MALDIERATNLRMGGDSSAGRFVAPKRTEKSPWRQINTFSIIPRVYEAELDKKYGIQLESLRNGERSNFQGDLENNVSFNGSGSYSVDEIERKILKKYESIPDFCSMRVDSGEELMKHVKFVHELAYNHYVFGKEKNIKGQFPNWCCGKSARNLLLTLMEKGYPNAALFFNGYHDHAYNGLSFLFGKNKERGFIIVDPTSDQLFNDKENAPRNNLFVVSGAKWKYESDWKRGADLFPSLGNNSEFSNLHTLRNNPSSEIHESRNIKKYFKKVFKNSVEINAESL